MTSLTRGKQWIPYFVAILGTLFSIILSYVFWLDLEANFEFINIIQRNLPWLTLIFGISLSLMAGRLLRANQIAKQRTLALAKTNADLQKEVQERKLAEENKQRMETVLFQGQKLQAMGTLAGGIAHDFNNILYAINGYVEMAREDVPKETLVYQNLGKVLEASHRGQELVSRILAFSRKQQHKVDILNLKSTIEAALSLLKPTIPASTQILFDHPTDAFVEGNQTQIHQIFVNLINNAVDAMDGEGTVTITMSTIPAHDPVLEAFPKLHASKANYCKIEVTDSGHGMDARTMERIFEPFYTTKEVGKGTGLGLSIVHSIVKEHHGEITVSSQLGQGTTFMILMPECEPA